MIEQKDLKEISQQTKDLVLNKICPEIKKITEGYFRGNSRALGEKFNEETKDDKSLVTIADQETEKKIKELILKKFPTHGILGEEYGLEGVNQGIDDEYFQKNNIKLKDFGNSQGNEDCGADLPFSVTSTVNNKINDKYFQKNKFDKFLWTIDPIDGTLSFIAGRATFTTLITLDYCGKTLFSIVYQPILDEKYYYDGTSVFFQHGEVEAVKMVNSTVNKSLKDCIVATTGYNYFNEQEKKVFDEIAKQAKAVIYGGDAYLSTMLTMGTMDAIVEPNCLKFYDYRAPMDIIEYSGSEITDWDGSPLERDYYKTNKINFGYIAGNRKVCKEILEIIKKRK